MATRGGAPETGGAPIAYLPWVSPDQSSLRPASGEAHDGPREIGGAAELRQPIGATSRTFIETVELESDEADRADALVMRKLARQGLSHREVEAMLAAELTPEQVQFNIERYIRLGYIDDERLAESIVRTLRDRSGSSRGSIRRALSERGIPLGITEAVLSDLDDERELELATSLATDRLRRLSRESDDVQTRRVLAFLQRRGFTSSTASDALRSARDTGRSGER